MTAEMHAQSWRQIAGPLFVVRATGQISEFAGWVIVARGVGASRFGELSVAFLVARYAGLVADWGASVRGPRDVVRDDAGRSITRALIRRRAQLAVVLGAAFVLGCVVSGHARLAPLVSVIAMLGLSRDWVSLGHRRGARSALPALVQGLVLLAGAIMWASPSTAAWGPALAYAAAAAASVALNRLPPAMVTGASVPLDGWMLVAVLANQVISSADTILLGVLASTTAAGIYAAVYRIPNGWLAAVAILAGALLPLATGAAHDRPRFNQLRRNSTRVSLTAAAGLLAITPIIYRLIPTLFGAAFESGRRPVVILLIATAIATAVAPFHHLFLASESDRRYAIILMMAAVGNVAVNLVLIPRYSMTGAAIATLAANIALGIGIVSVVMRGKRGSAVPEAGP